MLLERAVPWPMPEKNFCHFYHSMSFPNGDDVTGHWDWQGGRLQASAEDDLRTLLAFSPSFRLLIAHGLSDMVHRTLSPAREDYARRWYRSGLRCLRGREGGGSRHRHRSEARFGNHVAALQGTSVSVRRYSQVGGGRRGRLAAHQERLLVRMA